MSKKLLLTTIIIGLIAMPQLVMAHVDEDHDHESAAASQTDIHAQPATAQEAMTSLQQSVVSLENLVATEKYADIHYASQDVGKAAHALSDKSEIGADKKIRLDGAIKQLDMQLDKLHDAADIKDKNGVAAGMKKVKSALTLIDAQIK
ncbi:MAG TPA: hypothetical protein VGE32_02910 [Cellvibrio sp.]